MSKSSCGVSSTLHIAARRCSAKQLSAPKFRQASAVHLSLAARALRKSSNEGNGRSFRSRKKSSACSRLQSVHHAKSQSNRVVCNHRAIPFRLRYAHWLHFHAMALRVFHNCRRSVKTHRLIVNQTRVKLRRHDALSNRHCHRPESRN